MAIRPGVAAPNLAPRLSEEIERERGGVEYRVLRSRSLVNRCTSPQMPFAWTANPYRGCAMGCRYCYAAYTHGFLGKDPMASFHDEIYLKRGFEAETARALARIARRGESIALGTATDPYQPAEAQEQATRRFLELCAQQRGLRLAITTKGALVLRDLDLLRRIHERCELGVRVSLISPRADLLRKIEPWAPPPEVRFSMLRQLAAAGLDAGISVAPVLPGLTDREADLDELLARAAAAGVRRASCQLLFLRSPTRESYLAFLAREFPTLVPGHRRAFARESHLQGAYADRVLGMVERLMVRHGFTRDARPAGLPAQPRQLGLWEG